MMEFEVGIWQQKKIAYQKIEPANLVVYSFSERKRNWKSMFFAVIFFTVILYITNEIYVGAENGSIAAFHMFCLGLLHCTVPHPI